MQYLFCIASYDANNLPTKIDITKLDEMSLNCIHVVSSTQFQ